MLYTKLKSSSSFIHRSRSGFTLVELLVAMTILAILGLSLGTVFINWSTSTVDNNRKMALQRAADLAVNHIRLILQEADSAVVGGGGSQLTIDSGGTIDVLSLGTVNNKQTMLLNGVNIIRDPINAGIEVDTLTFDKPIADNQVETTLKLKYPDMAGIDYPLEFRTTTTLRNYP